MEAFQFRNLYTISRSAWTGDQPVIRPLPTHRTTQAQNESTKTYMLQEGLKPTIPVLERVKGVYTSDRAATLIGMVPPCLGIY
jgi:hypothetical protein